MKEKGDDRDEEGHYHLTMIDLYPCLSESKGLSVDGVREKYDRKWPPVGQGRRRTETSGDLCQGQPWHSAFTRSPHAVHGVTGRKWWWCWSVVVVIAGALVGCWWGINY